MDLASYSNVFPRSTKTIGSYRRVKVACANQAPSTSARVPVESNAPKLAEAERAAALKALQDHKASIQDRLELPVSAGEGLSSKDSTDEDKPDLAELDSDTFHPFLKQNAGTLTIVDFYTAWCGPCKLMLPKLVELQEQMPDLRFVKFNCNKKNKELGTSLGIKTVPTYQLYRNSEKVAELTGAYYDKLVALIDEHK